MVGRVMSTASATRQHVIAFLSSALGGDALAAEYTLLALLSRVHSRRDTLALGKYSVSLTNARQPQAQFVREAVSLVCAKCCLLPLTTAALSSCPLVPWKDYRFERLVQTPLQLTPGTVLVLDETALAPGQLDAAGAKNVAALSELLQWQRLTYDFQYHSSEFPADIPIIGLSAQGHSILEGFDCVVPIRSIAPVSRATVPSPLLASSFLDSARDYIAVCRELASNVEPAISEMIQEHFVQARKRTPDAVTQTTLHRWMTTARLVSLSFGEQSISRESWSHMLALEAQRESRAQAQALPRP
jgi:hypothetical protein